MRRPRRELAVASLWDNRRFRNPTETLFVGAREGATVKSAKFPRKMARRTGRFSTLAHPGSRAKGVFNRGIWTSVASARRHSRRTKETAPLSPRWQSKQPNATTSPDTALELSRRRQIPPFAAVYTREPPGVRQRSVSGDPLRKNAPTASVDDGFAAHLSV